MKRCFQWALCALLLAGPSTDTFGQPIPSADSQVEKSVAGFFTAYSAPPSLGAGQARVLSCKVDQRHRQITVTASEHFAWQDFTEKSVRKIYKRLAKALPKPYNKYDITVLANGLPIEELVPGSYSVSHILDNAWGEVEYDGHPWVSNISRPNAITHGLQNRHISLWASHGMYYDGKKAQWHWQRPNLFGTTEDLFTQTIVVPYLIPMLERAGAVVYTPRERDWQTHETVVDNDAPATGYAEEDGRAGWRMTPDKGFAVPASVIRDGDRPFTAGTARMAKAISKGDVSTASYQPDIPESGRYAVYVSYQTLSNSVSDAEYTVCHRGQKTVFHVNQRMGGSTWVYLGTFDFDAGSSPYNCVLVTNKSRDKGYVTTDAVRFGGGMGNVERGGMRSGMPRCLEGARYSAQWSGVPYRIYSTKSGGDDYGDDINVRPLSTNWLSGGSVYVPALDGKKVPIELSLAVHSDAGWSPQADGLIGSLAVCTTNFNDGRLNSGISRMASRDLADALLSGIQRDIVGTYGKWNRRDIYDRNYSETRNPEVPSAIIETMSHQNFADMRRGHDPNFKFTLARSIYKTLLRYIDHQHGRPCIVQPLAPRYFRAELVGNDKVRLSWLPTEDPLEPTAVPTAYNVYTASGYSDFDNGQTVTGTSCTLDITPGSPFHFRVTAVNRGGESFPTEVMSVYVSPKATKTVMVVDGFKRLAGPAVIDDGTRQGFDFNADIGVSYGLTAGWSGAQTCFDKSLAGKEGTRALGYCGNEMAGQFVMGNTFDYVATHTEAIAASGQYNVVSASSEAIETGLVTLDGYDAVDLILGLQKDDGYSLVRYKTFSPALRQKIAAYVRTRKALMVSGAYVYSGMGMDAERQFLSSTLKVDGGEEGMPTGEGDISGLGMTFGIYSRNNHLHYAVPRADVVHPAAGAFTAMQYASGGEAAVAYKGNDYRCFVMGFPFECIKDKKQRQQIMQGVMGFLLK